MNEPRVGYNYNTIESYEYYYDIEDRPLFTPICFINEETSAYLKYSERFTPRYHKSYTNLLDNFKNSSTILEKFIIKNCKFLVSQGIIFRWEEDAETTSDKLYPLIVFCFDEETDWTQKKKYKIIIDVNQLSHSDCKSLRPKLLKLLEEYTIKYDADIIYTKNLKQYCFNTYKKKKFKSIKEQKEYLNSLVEEAV